MRGALGPLDVTFELTLSSFASLPVVGTVLRSKICSSSAESVTGCNTLFVLNVSNSEKSSMLFVVLFCFLKRKKRRLLKLPLN